MNQLYLVQPVDSYGPNKFLPLAISYQWLFAQREGWEVAGVLIEKLPISHFICGLQRVDMVAMSCYVWNWEYSKELARQIKKRFPGAIIVVGGPQISKKDPDFFKRHPYFDLAVHGEGESSFREILARFPERNWEGIVNVQTPNCLVEGNQVRAEGISALPSPILTGFYDSIMEKYPADTLWQVTFETMRGCPYQCSYCDMGDVYWNKLKLFDIDRIKKEIDWMGERKIEYVSVCDSNWGMFERDLEITKYVVEKKLATGYPRIWDVTIAKNNSKRIFEIARLNKNANTKLFKGVTFAMQSLNPGSLEATSRFNIREDEVRAYLLEYKREDIPTYSELIWPLPAETYRSLKAGIQELINLGQDDFLMVHPLVLTPNAPIAQAGSREKFGIKTKIVPLDTYFLNVSGMDEYVVEYTEAVCETATASEKDVIEGFLFSYVVITFYYYGWAHYLSKYVCRAFQISEVDFFERLKGWIKDNPESMMGREYAATHEALRSTYDRGHFWGRQVLGAEDIFWEYKSASSVVFQANFAKLQFELEEFVAECFGEEYVRAVEYGLLACCNFSKNYPFEVKLDRGLVKEMFSIDSDRLKIDCQEKQGCKTEKDFYHLAYHYQRKNRFWKNSISAC